MASVPRWIAFVWGCAALAGMSYFFGQWLAYGRVGNEALIGFMLFAFYGWPAWIGLPIFTIAEWRQLRPVVRVVSLLPLVAAVCLYAIARLLSPP